MILSAEKLAAQVVNGESSLQAFARQRREEASFRLGLWVYDEALRTRPKSEHPDLREARDRYIAKNADVWHRIEVYEERRKLKAAVRAGHPAALVAMQKIRIEDLEWKLKRQPSDKAVRSLDAAKCKLTKLERLAASTAPVLEAGGSR
jgi:hypothetical protein